MSLEETEEDISTSVAIVSVAAEDSCMVAGGGTEGGCSFA